MIFVDTGAFLARYLEQDQYHHRARRAWQRLREDRARLRTSNFVLDELFTLLGRRSSYAFAAGRARHILTSERLEILRPDSIQRRRSPSRPDSRLYFRLQSCYHRC